MNIDQGTKGTQEIIKEVFSLSPSAIISLFEIDVSKIAFDQGVASPIQSFTNLTDGSNLSGGFENFDGISGVSGFSGNSGYSGGSGVSGSASTGTEDVSDTSTVKSDPLIFRFHNCLHLTTKSIFWRGKEYLAAPIKIKGIEKKSSGTIPRPELSISVDINNYEYLSALKRKIFELNDLTGAKLTRYMTFAKYIDAENFNEQNKPSGFQPNPFVELPREIYIIDRKSFEDKTSMAFELVSPIDVEGIQLPKRVIIKKCVAKYRCEGCLYEYAQNKNPVIHGRDAVLPETAPPVATEYDELITDILRQENGRDIPITVLGAWSKDRIYQAGQAVTMKSGGILYYFVARRDGVVSTPPNESDWIADKCSKETSGCLLRYPNGNLQYVGFPAADKIR